MNPLVGYYLSIGFSEADAHTIAHFFTVKHLAKNEYFVTEGKISLQIGFLETGLLHYYSLTEKGEERTTYISLPSTFVASLLSYLSEIPARENIRTLSPSTLWVIDKKDVIYLQSTLPAFKDFYVQLLEWQICCIDKGKFDLITLTAEERYEKLLNEEPELLQQAPLQYIASMMGITPRHLSRLRGKI